MSATGIYWEEAKNAAKHPIMHWTAPLKKKDHLVQMLIVLQLGNVALNPNILLSFANSHSLTPVPLSLALSLITLSITH